MTSLVGQDSVWEECMKQMDTPSHIFLTGPPGCGKTTLVQEWLHVYATRKGYVHRGQWGHEITEECYWPVSYTHLTLPTKA